MKQNLIFGLVFGRLAVLKISVIEQKYATFEGRFFFMFSRAKEIDCTSPRDLYVMTLLGRK